MQPVSSCTPSGLYSPFFLGLPLFLPTPRFGTALLLGVAAGGAGRAGFGASFPLTSSCAGSCSHLPEASSKVHMSGGVPSFSASAAAFDLKSTVTPSDVGPSTSLRPASSAAPTQAAPKDCRKTSDPSSPTAEKSPGMEANEAGSVASMTDRLTVTRPEAGVPSGEARLLGGTATLEPEAVSTTEPPSSAEKDAEADTGLSVTRREDSLPGVPWAGTAAGA
mmetsp:Transcript_36622/g.101693  ORF Transcript_36622/g.101693 Transcript_36622/m.101693 type:complete len:221 (+) Transcript_36622:848-1510(+)